jgi:hypothetical protein
MDCRPRSRPCNPLFKEPGACACLRPQFPRAHARARLGNASPSLDGLIGGADSREAYDNRHPVSRRLVPCSLPRSRDLGRLARGRGSPSGGRRGGKLPLRPASCSFLAHALAQRRGAGRVHDGHFSLPRSGLLEQSAAGDAGPSMLEDDRLARRPRTPDPCVVRPLQNTAVVAGDPDEATRCWIIGPSHAASDRIGSRVLFRDPTALGASLIMNNVEREIDTLLYGRRMYEIMAGYWPTARPGPFGARRHRRVRPDLEALGSGAIRTAPRPPDYAPVATRAAEPRDPLGS